MKAYQPLLEKYGRQAATYDRRWNIRWGQATMWETISAIPWAGAHRVLDVGCGTGLLERAVSPRLGGNAILIGLDLSAAMLQEAQRQLDNLPRSSRIAFANAPAEQLPFADHTFDAVVCNNSFHYCQHPDQVLAEFHRVLRPSGHLVLTDWCSDFPSTRIAHWLLRFVQEAGLHRYSLKRCYTVRELQALLLAAGFRVEGARKVAMEFGWGIAVMRARA